MNLPDRDLLTRFRKSDRQRLYYDSRWPVQGSSYLNRFLTWRAEMSDLPGVNDSTPTYVVQPTDAASFFITDEVFNLLPARNDYPFLVLPTRALAGDVHFTADSYEQIGRDMMPTIWAEQERFTSFDSLELSVTVAPSSSLESDFAVTVVFSGTRLYFSDNLIDWLEIQGAVSPFTQSVPRTSNKRFYKTLN